MTDTLGSWDPIHHDDMAALARKDAETFRSYLDWSDDPDVRAWAKAKSAARIADAVAEETLARAIRARLAVSA